MKKIIFAFVFFCVALLPSQILGDNLLVGVLGEMAKNGRIINNIFQPSKEGYLGKGSSSFTYKGTLLLPPYLEVAMKFTHDFYKEFAITEYEIYTCLNAIDNEKIEAYGIASVSYYGSWENYTLMAITLLDSEFESRRKAFQLTELDILIICREFVRISKYIHCRGILHNDMHLGNIMLRNNRVFVVDYNAGYKFYIDSKSEEDVEIIRGIERTKNDWRKFMDGIESVVKNQNIGSAAVSKVISELSKSAFGNDQKKLNYNEVYEIINQEIKGINRNGTAFVSWLAPKQRQNESEQEPIPTIDSIDEPSDHVVFDYPVINYNYFVRTGTSSRGSRNFDLNAKPKDDLDLELSLGRR